MKKWALINGVIENTKVAGDRAKRPELKYSYQIKDSVYWGTSDLAMPAFGGKNYKAQSSKAVISRFNIGDSIIVYYNPAEPIHSVLNISPKWSSYLQYGLGIVFLALSFGLLHSGLLERK